MSGGHFPVSTRLQRNFEGRIQPRDFRAARGSGIAGHRFKADRRGVLGIMENLLVRAGSSLYHGPCMLLSMLGLSLNLRHGRDLISRLHMGPVRTGHSFFAI